MHFREEEKQAENRWRLFLKTSIELSVYIYIKKVAEKEALLRRGDAFCQKYIIYKNCRAKPVAKRKRKIATAKRVVKTEKLK